jgi:hypothetical protein
MATLNLYIAGEKKCPVLINLDNRTVIANIHQDIFTVCFGKNVVQAFDE